MYKCKNKIQLYYRKRTKRKDDDTHIPSKSLNGRILAE